MKDIRELAVQFHDVAEELENAVNKAKSDRRFKMGLVEARKVRDLIDDAEVVANRAWRGTMEIPLEVADILAIKAVARIAAGK